MGYINSVTQKEKLRPELLCWGYTYPNKHPTHLDQSRKHQVEENEWTVGQPQCTHSCLLHTDVTCISVMKVTLGILHFKYHKFMKCALGY